MKRFWKIFRVIAVSLLLLAVGLPAGLYVALSTPWAQGLLCRVAVEELSGLLSTDVHIDRVMLHPFNRISVYGISADDDYGLTAVSITEVSAGFELRHFLTSGKIVIDYALVDGARIDLYKLTPDSPLNVADILDKLRGDDKQKPPTRFDLKINTVILRNALLRYDVRSLPRRLGFDPNHISLTGLNLNAYIPRLSNEQYTVEIDRLNFRESGGFVLSDFTTRADVRSNGIDLSELKIHLPQSQITLAPLKLDFDRFEQLPEALATVPVRVGIEEGSYMYLPDLQAFLPQLADMPLYFDLSLEADASLAEVDLLSLNLSDRSGAVSLAVQGQAEGLRDSLPPHFDIPSLHIHGDGPQLCSLLTPVLPGKADKLRLLRRMRVFDFDAAVNGTLQDASVDLSLTTATDAVYVRGSYRADKAFRNLNFDADIDVDNVNLAEFTGNSRLGIVSGAVSAAGRLSGRRFTGEASLQCDRFDFNGYHYHGIEGTVEMGKDDATFNLNAADQNLAFELQGNYAYADACKQLSAHLQLDKLDLYALHLIDRYEGYSLNAKVDLDLLGRDIDDITGRLELSNAVFHNTEKDLALQRLIVDMQRSGDYDQLSIDSDIFKGRASGRIKFSTIGRQLQCMVADVLPVLTDPKATGEGINDFNYDFTLSNTDAFTDFFHLPIRVIYPVSISGNVNSPESYADLTVDAPYLQQGDKIIEGTALVTRIDGTSNHGLVYGTTRMPTKKGPLGLVFTINGSENRVDTHFDWMIERKIPINGKIDFSTLLFRNDDSQLGVDVDFNRSDITFGSDVWEICPARLRYDAGKVNIEHFRLQAADQSIAIDGVAGPTEADSLFVSLDNVELIEIFETLEIDKAMIGGRASGRFEGTSLLSSVPHISTDRLYVENIGYNRCTLGNAEVKAHFDNDKQSFYLDADIVEPGGRHSHIYGDIVPATESLDISFDADRVRVGFMKPFMEAFAGDIDGYASGHARLFGTFKYIDMEGDIFADSLRIKIDFTNTWYGATDSIHLTPGLIDIKNVTVTDFEGHTALLNGVVKHKFFKEPAFDFAVTDARDFLCYDTDARLNPDWYGRVYGNGSAFITGWPGVVNINVNMTTAPHSHFTFVLSDQLIADEYSFITFRRKPGTGSDTISHYDDVPPEVKLARERAAAKTIDTPSAYNMDIQVDITPDAAMTIVMDPVGGDEIKATGAGNMRLTYGSVNNDLRMYGEYTLENGSYNFTLQDIIIKDFTINQGSSIAFRGDPYNAQLNIRAVYQVNANLSDLDESFLQDKDLNRTNVPVQALLIVTGDMRAPDIKFDLLFPTLNEDIYRKVHSIVSTEDMMNRQIIYLLALNRFYTPDYMASTTKGNEVFAVASSTISSQLSSMLGKLSDHWSIAPNLRSDRGDFSDVEVDVALSSRLLNNRLLFNGNFGYRDKSLNTNQFIGDFDIEYLLNRRGSWRLKAYNRYNDQNYYVRTAATTQGVGVMFRRDFDDFFKFLRKRKPAAQSDSLPTGTQQTNLINPIHHNDTDNNTQ